MQQTRSYLKDFDQFSAPAILRIKGSPETKSSCTGFVTYVLYALIIYFLVIKSMKLFENDDIQFSQALNYNIQSDNSLSTNKTFFGIRFQKTGAQHFTISETLSMFHIYMNHTVQGNQTTTHTLKQCTRQQWKKFIIGQQASGQVDQNFQSEYPKDNINFEQFLCPTQGVKLQGLASNNDSTTAQIHIEPCFYNSSDQTTIGCYSYDNISEQLTKIINEDFFVVMEFIYTDVKLNPKNTEAEKKYINFDTQFTFTLSRGTYANIRFGHYNIQEDTDYFWPSQQTQQGPNGFFQTDTNFQSFERSNLGKPFIIVNLGLSPTEIQIQRVFGKFDLVLGDVGGLMGVIVTAIGFFVLSYNQYRYELKMASGAFNLDEEGEKIKSSNFNFFHYMIYSFYGWIETLLCCQIKKGKFYQSLDQTRQQANKQLDVSYLYRRLQHLQRVQRYIMDEKQQMCLNLLQPHSIAKTQNRRLISQYYDQVIQGTAAKTFEDALDENQYDQQQNIRMKPFSKAYEIPYSFDVPQSMTTKKIMQRAYQKFAKQKKEAKQIFLEDQYDQVEDLFSEAFFELSQERKKAFLLKIPVKIIERLRIKRKQKKEQSGDSADLEIIN